MSSSDTSTEAQLLEAARAVFVRRGTHAASLKEIAGEADVNQALLHYYFRDKKTLADTVFEEVASEFIPEIQTALVGEQPVEDKVETIVQKYVDFLRENPYLPSYIVGELNQNPEEMKQRLRSMGLAPFEELDRLDEQLQKKADAGEMRPISAKQFVVNLLSLCIFPFIARPLIETILDMDDDAFEQFIDEPTSGVDPVTRRQFWEIIYEATADGTTVLVTTHYMDEAEYCDRVSIMGEGTIDALGTPAALKADHDLVTGQTPDERLVVSGEKASAGVVQSYAQQILQDVAAEYRNELQVQAASAGTRARVDVRSRLRYNATLEYDDYMAIGILTLLVTLIGTLLTAQNIAREREIGTIEQLNVTPITKGQFVAGKLLPFWVLGLAEFGVGLTVAWLAFDIPMQGSLLLLFGVAGIYLTVALGIGL